MVVVGVDLREVVGRLFVAVVFSFWVVTGRVVRAGGAVVVVLAVDVDDLARRGGDDLDVVKAEGADDDRAPDNDEVEDPILGLPTTGAFPLLPEGPRALLVLLVPTDFPPFPLALTATGS